MCNLAGVVKRLAIEEHENGLFSVDMMGGAEGTDDLGEYGRLLNVRTKQGFDMGSACRSPALQSI